MKALLGYSIGLLVIGIALICVGAIAGCEQEGKSVDETDNSNFVVAELFTHKGCTVYRFRDNGRSHYFTDCRGSTTSTYTEKCGNSRCARDEEIETGR